MEEVKCLLVANRGEIAVRIVKTAKRFGIRTIAIYTAADATSQHVSVADEAFLLPGDDSTAYTNGTAIIEIARFNHADAIIPGYGFLSENTEFAKEVANSGMVFVGPKPDAIEAFGLKHRAREMAVEAGVPVVPGTQALLTTDEEATQAADKLGYPVMLKATAGGGGMGLMICHSADEVAQSFAQVRSRGQALFKNDGVFLERYYPKSHHIEVQVFGNGLGEAIHIGERECSIQRRHQKVVEECPSPFAERHAGLREKLTSAAVALAESVRYGSAGTVEYLVDDLTSDFFFLEMNTRLQVEHGITELCYNLDLVELMLRQADRELSGHGGLDGKYLKSLQPEKPSGAAIEVRVYAENPVRNFQPSPGLLQHVQWAELPGTRIDTWVMTGSKISTFYDPMIAKIMVHASDRNKATVKICQVLSKSKLCGPPTNLDFLHAIMQSSIFASGHTLTNFLGTFEFNPTAIEVVSPGVYTTVQDLGRPRAGYGIPQAGPMDPLAFQVANFIAGNPRTTEGLEITLKGPELRFWAPAVVSVCGTPMEMTIDGAKVPMWTRLHIKRGQTLSIGKLSEKGGCRAYMAVLGGFPAIAPYFNSKSTSPLLAIGGYQGRALAPGDMLVIQEVELPTTDPAISLPTHLRPGYSTHWDIFAMVGPYDEGYILSEDIAMIYDTTWKVSHNATRGGIRLIGPTPRWARKDGGEGGQHPSNVIEYGYPLGTLNWTGESPCVFPIDAPDLGGFISTTTIVTGSLWRLGQVKSGDTLQYHRVSLDEAVKIRAQLDNFLDNVAAYVAGEIGSEDIQPLKYSVSPKLPTGDGAQAIVHQTTINESRTEVSMTFRQGGDDFLLIEYGEGKFDLNHRCRVTALEKAIREYQKSDEIWSNSIYKMIGCCNSLLVHYDGSKLRRQNLVEKLLALQQNIGDQSTSKVPSRRFRLPICFESPAQEEAIQRYIETQRPHAPFLPSNMDFVARINGITREELIKIFITADFMAICVGFFCADTNPSRVYTPEGSVSWGGSCMNIYPADSPGGYQMTGQTIPCFDQLGVKPGFQPSQPGLFQPFDQVTFYRVDKKEFERDMALFKSGRYKFQFDDTIFDMEAHNRLLEETRDEVETFHRQQDIAEVEILALEKESLERWNAEKAQNELPQETLMKLQSDPDILCLEAPLDANVWKVNGADGDIISAGQVVIILEAMKMEISLHYGDRKEGDKKRFRVEKVLVSPGGTVKAGDLLLFLKEA